MHDWLVATWYGGSRRGGWLAPLGWLYGLLAGLRRRAFQGGLLRRYRSSRTVVVVGNLTVGGTGKTPLILWLAERLSLRGHRVGVVSRGYGRRSLEPRRVVPADPAAEVGDEPALIARRRLAPVAVGADRGAAVRLLEADCDLILSDDGLQHYALERDAEIVVLDGARGLGNGRRLPAGPLREGAGRLEEVDAVVVNGSSANRTGAFAMTLSPTRVVGISNGVEREPGSLRGRRVHAVAAIGNPQRFFDLLAGLGMQVEPHPLPDHLELAAGDIRFGDALPVLMTEKDAVKCIDFAGTEHWYLEVGAVFAPADGERLLDIVESAHRRRAAPATA